MTFKSGNAYEFSTQNYIKGAKAELRRFSGQAVERLEKAIKEESNRKILEDAEYRDIRHPVLTDMVSIEFEDPVQPEEESIGDLADFELMCSSASSNESGRVGEDFQDNVLTFMETMFMTQSFSRLASGPDTDWVEVATGDDSYGKTYFYTRHETKNGFEIWYKAYDPIIWFGKAVKA